MASLVKTKLTLTINVGVLEVNVSCNTMRNLDEPLVKTMQGKSVKQALYLNTGMWAQVDGRTRQTLLNLIQSIEDLEIGRTKYATETEWLNNMFRAEFKMTDEKTDEETN